MVMQRNIRCAIIQQRLTTTAYRRNYHPLLIACVNKTKQLKHYFSFIQQYIIIHCNHTHWN